MEPHDIDTPGPGVAVELDLDQAFLGQQFDVLMADRVVSIAFSAGLDRLEVQIGPKDLQSLDLHGLGEEVGRERRVRSRRLFVLCDHCHVDFGACQPAQLD